MSGAVGVGIGVGQYDLEWDNNRSGTLYIRVRQ